MNHSFFKSIALIFIPILVTHNLANAQITDTVMIKKLSINRVCLCNTTLSALEQINSGVKETEVEEMDIAKGCFGEDSRFIAGKGYSFDNYPGIIFQKDQETDQISKIRLTKQFSGKLPDGKFIDMGKLMLKDVLAMYPKLNDTWGSRGCSDYWSFSDSTLTFYVKIDPDKKPQFPIDKSYYLNKPIEGVDLVTSCYAFQSHEQGQQLQLFDPNDPVFFLDSIRVNKGVLENYQPSEIATLTVYKGANAIKRAGPEAKNGLIYIETKAFARRKYWRYFCSKSIEYKKAVPTDEGDGFVQYVLNNKVLKKDYEADLAGIDDKSFRSITIIDKSQLIKEYSISDKEYGVIIQTDVTVKAKKN